MLSSFLGRLCDELTRHEQTATAVAASHHKVIPSIRHYSDRRNLVPETKKTSNIAGTFLGILIEDDAVWSGNTSSRTRCLERPIVGTRTHSFVTDAAGDTLTRKTKEATITN